MGKVIVFSLLVALGGASIIFLANSQSTSEKQKQEIGFLSPTPTRPQPPTSTPTPTLKPTPSATDSAVATQAAIMTSKGEIVFEFYRSDAPNTVENFESKVKSAFYNNLTFHRVEDWVIQGGDPKGNGTGGGELKTEINKKPFVIGAVGVARGGNKEISNDSQFFITKKDASWLNEEYTNFGIVKSGMEVVEKIAIGDKILSITLR